MIFPLRPVLLAAVVLAALPSPALELHVAPSGNDSHAGTADAPLATLAAARDRLRQAR